MFEGIQFLNKDFFWLLLLLPLAVFWYVLKHRVQTSELKISSLKGFKLENSWLPKAKHFLFVLRLLALTLLIVAMARPQTVDVSSRTKTTKGIDIVMAIDVSASMLAKDLKPNRLEALKGVAAEFIKWPTKRQNWVSGVRRRKLYQNTNYQRQIYSATRFKGDTIQYHYRRWHRYWNGLSNRCKPLKR